MQFSTRRAASSLRLSTLGVAALTAAQIATVAHAQTTYTWNGGGANANWSTGGNWSTGTAPASDLTNTFVALSGLVQLTNTLDYALSANSLTYNASAGAFITGGSNTLTLGAGGVVDNSASVETFNAPIALGAAQSWNVVSGGSFVTGAVANGGFALTNAGADLTTITGGLTGTGALTQSGTGTLTLTGANTYSGATLVNNGTLTFNGSATASGNGSLNVATTATGNTATLNLNSSGTIAFNNGAAITVGGATNSAGAINQTSGTVNLGVGTGYLSLGIGTSSYGSYVLSGGTLNISPTTNGGTRISGTGTGIFTQTGGTLTVTRYFAIGNGTGTGIATFTGGTASNVNAAANGIFVGDAAAATAFLNLGTEAGGTALVINNGSNGVQVADGNVTTGSGTLNLNSGTLQLTSNSIRKGSASTTATSTVNFNGGTVQAGAAGLTLIDNTPTSVNVYNGGAIFDTQANNATVSANLLTTTGNGIYASSGTLALGTLGTGYTGAPAVTVSGGSGTGATAIANVVNGVVTGVTLTNPGKGYAAGDTLTFAFTGGGATTAAGNTNYTLTAANLAANGAGGLTKLGTGMLALTGTNTYTGITNISAGTLALITTGTIAASSTIQIASGATLDASALTGGASFANGSFSLASGQSLTGTGTVVGPIDFRSGASVSPGINGAGLVTFNGNTTLESGSNFLVNLNGKTAGTGYDQIAVNGTLTLNAATLNAILGYAPSASDNLFILTNDGTDAITGNFTGLAQGSSISLAFGGTNYTGKISYTGDSASNAFTGGNDVVLYSFTSSASAPEPGAFVLIALGGLPLGIVARRKKA